MSLATVRKLDKHTRAGILAHVAQKYLPTFEDFSPYADDANEVQVIDEINRKFNASRGDIPTSKLEVVQRMLLNELRASVVDHTQIKNVRERVGQKGLLRTDLYDIRFSQSFLDLNVTMGVSKDLVINTIHKPLAVEHIFPEKEGLTQVDSHSIFTGLHPRHENCVVVILAIRKFATLTVDGAWLMFLSDMHLFEPQSPVQMLKAFACHYGVPLKVEQEESHFIYQSSFAIESGNGSVEVQTINPAGLTIDARFSFSTSWGQVQIALAFAIRLVDYIADLKKHGVRITRTVSSGQVAS